MSNEKMRADFETWARDSGQFFSNFCRCDDGSYDDQELNSAWNGYQAATAATQRDAMAVAEAVRLAMVQSCESWPGIVEATKRIDLAAIIEAVRPGKPEPVNQQLLDVVHSILAPDMIDLLPTEYVAKVRAAIAAAGCQPVSVTNGYAQGIEAVAKMLEKKADVYADEYGHDDMGSLSFGGSLKGELMRDYHSGLLELAEEVRGMPTTEAAQPASDQQQGEPVAWFKTSGSLKSLCFDSDPTIRLGADSEVKADSVRPLIFADAAPPDTACSVPDGYALVPVEATDAMIEAAWDSDGTDYVGEHKRIWRFGLAYKAAIAAAPKPEGGA